MTRSTNLAQCWVGLHSPAFACIRLQSPCKQCSSAFPHHPDLPTCSSCCVCSSSALSCGTLAACLDSSASWKQEVAGQGSGYLHECFIGRCVYMLPFLSFILHAALGTVTRLQNAWLPLLVQSALTYRPNSSSITQTCKPTSNSPAALPSAPGRPPPAPPCAPPPAQRCAPPAGAAPHRAPPSSHHSGPGKCGRTSMVADCRAGRAVIAGWDRGALSMGQGIGDGMIHQSLAAVTAVGPCTSFAM